MRLPATILLAAALGGAAMAADFSPAILYDFGGKFDRSFNQSAAEGAERFHKATGIPVREYEIQNASQREQVLRQFVRRGCTIIVAVGFTQASAVETVAKEYPGTKFAVIDGVVDLPNVQSINFKEQESSFLCGMAAAMASKTRKVGFVGGMDIPLIRKFALGYRAGVAYVDPKVEVFENMTGSTPAAWTNPSAGAELAKGQFGRGVDVIFHAAGATGIGVMQAAADAGLLSIGCDSNQDYLHPGSVLTSALKRVDVAVWTVFNEAMNGTWKPGPRVLGLAEDGVGYSLDADNRKLISPEMERRLNQARADIIVGKVTVPEYKSP
ncbi:MAG TPA: BMP family ABC transporter substrate-binding protein [Opitutaceae bacterium]